MKSRISYFLKAVLMTLICFGGNSVVLPRAIAEIELAPDLRAQQIYNSICKNNNLSSEELKSKIINEILNFSETRLLLNQELQAGRGANCLWAVDKYITEILNNPKREKVQNGHMGLVLLGLAAKMAPASQLIEAEVKNGASEEWLESLKKADKTAYSRALQTWVNSVAEQVREIQNIQTTSPKLYGATAIDSNEPARVPLRIIGPLMVDRYLRDVSQTKRKLNPPELAALNAIFAGSEAGYRQIFLQPLVGVIRPQAVEWIQSFRSEPVWVQVKLFPLVSAVGGTEVVRELVWLSQNHRDLRVRSIAGRALDDLVDKKK